MSGVGIMVGLGANALILGGGAAAASWATGGFGEDAANAAKEAAGVQAAGSDEAQKGQTLANAKIAKMLAKF